MMMRRLFVFLLTACLGLAGALPAAAAPKKEVPVARAEPVVRKATAVSSKPATSKSSASAVSKPAPKPAKREVQEAFPAEDGNGPPSIQAAAAIVLDAQTGKVLFEHNADDARPVASTQKLLTALIVAEEGALDGDVTVQSSDMDAEPSKLYIKSGEVYGRGKLLQILLVKSMNDVARCLARDNAGSIEAFAAKMNARPRNSA